MGCPPPPPTTPGRLRLRCLTPADRDLLVAMHRDPRVRALLIDDMAFDDARFSAFFLERLQQFYVDHPGLGLWATEHWVSSLTLDHPDYAEAQACLQPHALARALQPQPEFVGWFNLMPMPDQPDEIELGCRLLPQVWGGGLAMEGGALLLAHAFERLQRERVWAVCHPDHAAVQLRLHMLGFRPDGERPYQGIRASWFLIAADAWQASRVQPLARRRRRAMEWLKGRAAV